MYILPLFLPYHWILNQGDRKNTPFFQQYKFIFMIECQVRNLIFDHLGEAAKIYKGDSVS